MTGGNPDRDTAERAGAPESSSRGRGPDTGDRQGPEGWLDEEILADELSEAASEERERGVGIIGGDAPDLNALENAVTQRDEYLDALRRLQAEFENYKKRVAKQQADQSARAAVTLLEKLLPVLDTLDLAIEHVDDPGSIDGRALEAVHSQLRDVLTKEGLERISPIGERFDPTAHEAVGHLPPEEAGTGAEGAGGGADDGTGTGAGEEDGEPRVAQVMRAGYRWKGSVLRPAMVMVRG